MGQRSIEDFNAAINEVAVQVKRSVDARLKKKSWKYVIFDVRWYPNGSIYTSRMHVMLSDGTLKRENDPDCDELEDTLYAIGKMRVEVFPQIWFGCSLQVSPDGNCEVGFNYDSTCATANDFV